MKKLLLIASLSFLLGACSIYNTNSSSNGGNPSDPTSSSASVPTTYNLAELQAAYGEFTCDDPNATFSSDRKTLTIDVTALKKEVILSGYYDGTIIIANRNSLSAYKKLELNLQGACLVSQTEMPAIYYTLESKNVTIVSKGATTNYIINTMSGNNGAEYAYAAVYSANHAKLDLRKESTLNIFTEYGHCVKADDEIRLFGKGNLNLSSGHDGLHGKNILTNNEEIDEKFTEFTGTLNCTYAFSQVMDFTSKSAAGYINLTTGTYIVNNVESVFKCDTTITINNGVSITATQVTLDPVVLGDNATELRITNNGTFTVNGSPYTQTVITK